jgi:hypothetical protein
MGIDDREPVLRRCFIFEPIRQPRGNLLWPQARSRGELVQDFRREGRDDVGVTRARFVGGAFIFPATKQDTRHRNPGMGLIFNMRQVVGRAESAAAIFSGVWVVWVV